MHNNHIGIFIFASQVSSSLTGTLSSPKRTGHLASEDEESLDVRFFFQLNESYKTAVGAYKHWYFIPLNVVSACIPH